MFFDLSSKNYLGDLFTACSGDAAVAELDVSGFSSEVDLEVLPDNICIFSAIG